MEIRGLGTVLAWIVRFWMNVGLSCAMNMTCSQTGDRTVYTVLGRPTSVDCLYSYVNATNHKIAHNDECVPALVLNNTVDSLVTSKCISQVFYEATCNEGQYYSANCTVVCSEFHDPKETSDTRSIVAAVLIVVVVVGVVMVVIVWKRLQHRCAQRRRRPNGQLVEP